MIQIPIGESLSLLARESVNGAPVAERHVDFFWTKKHARCLVRNSSLKSMQQSPLHIICYQSALRIELLGEDYFDRQDAQHYQNKFVNKLEALGLKIALKLVMT